MTDPQSPTSHSPYSFASLRYYCTSCQRPFSQLSVNESQTSQAHCPRCDTLSDPQSQPSEFSTPTSTAITTLQPFTSSPQIQAQETSYMYLTEVIEHPFGGVLIRTIRIPVPNILQETPTSTQDSSQNAEETGEQGTTESEQDENAGNRPDMLAHLLESLFASASAQAVFNMFAPVLEERLLEEFLRNDPNQYGPPPASEEAIKKLEEIKFDGVFKDTEGQNGACCSICKEEYQKDESLVKLPCQHDYHKECVNTWLSKHNSCPMCRQAI